MHLGRERGWRYILILLRLLSSVENEAVDLELDSCLVVAVEIVVKESKKLMAASEGVKGTKESCKSCLLDTTSLCFNLTQIPQGQSDFDQI